MSTISQDLNNPNTAGRPQHRVHTADEPLPGARGMISPQQARVVESGTGTPQHDQHFADHPRQDATYGAHGDTYPNTSGAGNVDHYPPTNASDAHRGLGYVPHYPERSQHHTGASGVGTNTFNSERPLGVCPAQAGGVPIGGRSNMPLGKAGFVDKVIGKTEKVVGKATNDPEMHERGKLRETGGRGAANGWARS